MAHVVPPIERCRYFDAPFGHIVQFGQLDRFCSYCMRAPLAGQALLACSACSYARYCSKECQRLAWKDHKAECRRLIKVFPNLPLTEVLFLSRIADRVLFIRLNGDRYKWEKDRKFDELLGHEEEIQKDTEKMAHFEKIFNKFSAFRPDELLDRAEFFSIFCKTSINSHSIHTNAGTEIGMALDLGISRYDHSCRPNCSLIFDGFRVCLRPLTPDTNAWDPKTAYISYIDVGRSRFQRRRELRAKWYFDCACERCIDPLDDVLTSIRCPTPGCDEPLITVEDREAMHIACGKCRRLAEPEYVQKAQELMKTLPARFSMDTDPEELRECLHRAETLLHPKNIYLCRLQTALMHITGTLNENLLQPAMQKQIYENYKQYAKMNVVVRQFRCFPQMDRHIGYQLLHLVKTLIETDKREEAVPYAFEAMCIFEVCFGLQHPYYLQTLALWTFLEKKIGKSNDELLALITFGDNRPVDIAPLLATAVPAV